MTLTLEYAPYSQDRRSLALIKRIMLNEGLLDREQTTLFQDCLNRLESIPRWSLPGWDEKKVSPVRETALTTACRKAQGGATRVQEERGNVELGAPAFGPES